MRILMKSMYLFFLGVYTDLCKRKFDLLLDKQIKSGGDISSPLLTRRSNRCYNLYSKFLEYEKELRLEIEMKSLRKNII